MSAEFAIGEMTRFETAKDGSSARLDMDDINGCLVSLHMPLECLNRLIMTLPAMVKSALQRRHRDASFRIVYPVAQFRMEIASDFVTRILTLETPDGFSASFGLTEEQCREIGADDSSVLSLNCVQIGKLAPIRPIGCGSPRPERSWRSTRFTPVAQRPSE